jgi:predicted RNase H-like nuclease
VSLCLVALDQPTVVPNVSGSRPVDKVAASLVSFIGGGVQPANRGKTGMFCDDAPIWPFLYALGATQDPVAARQAEAGLFVMEVFPALALPSLSDRSSGRLMAPKYNPANRRKFRREDWDAVASTVAALASALGVPEMTGWADRMRGLDAPRKGDQDKLDAVLCVLVGLIWHAGPPKSSAMIGDLETGYMVAPLSPSARSRIEAAAKRRDVPVA